MNEIELSKLRCEQSVKTEEKVQDFRKSHHKTLSEKKDGLLVDMIDSALQCSFYINDFVNKLYKNNTVTKKYCTTNA